MAIVLRYSVSKYALIPSFYLIDDLTFRLGIFPFKILKVLVDVLASV